MQITSTIIVINKRVIIAPGIIIIKVKTWGQVVTIIANIINTKCVTVSSNIIIEADGGQEPKRAAEPSSSQSISSPREGYVLGSSLDVLEGSILGAEEGTRLGSWLGPREGYGLGSSLGVLEGSKLKMKQNRGLTRVLN
jgi:hypothetical protein